MVIIARRISEVTSRVAIDGCFSETIPRRRIPAQEHSAEHNWSRMLKDPDCDDEEAYCLTKFQKLRAFQGVSMFNSIPSSSDLIGKWELSHAKSSRATRALR
jgi:hypothetical protein